MPKEHYIYFSELAPMFQKQGEMSQKKDSLPALCGEGTQSQQVCDPFAIHGKTDLNKTSNGRQNAYSILKWVC